MNILISGGAGFIGSALAIELVRRGHEVTVLDNLSQQIHGSDPVESPLLRRIPGSVKLLVGDVRSRINWLEALENQDVVVHLAAETGTGQSMYEVDQYVDVNIRGTSLLLDIIAKKPNKIKRIVVASSRAVYGEGKYKDKSSVVYPEHRLTQDMENGNFECISKENGEKLTVVATDEDSKIHPTSIYGITKQVQEQLVMTACQALGLGCIALRYQNVYGPGQSLNNPYTGILSIFSTLLLQDKDINIFEDGAESRDFVYIDDVVGATIKAIETESVSGKAYNVGSGVPTTVLEVAETLKNLYNSTSEIRITKNFRIGDIRHNFANLSRARKDLGYVPNVRFCDGVIKFSEWVKIQNIKNIQNLGYEKSLQEMRTRGLFK